MHELLCFLVLTDQAFSLYFMFCYISSYLIKVKEKKKLGIARHNELFSPCCCQIRSAAITGILNQSQPMDIFTRQWSKPVNWTACHRSNYIWDSWLWTEWYLFPTFAIYKSHLHIWMSSSAFIPCIMNTLPHSHLLNNSTLTNSTEEDLMDNLEWEEVLYQEKTPTQNL